MNFKNLFKEAQNDKEKQLLKLCDPQQIAKQLMSKLEIEVDNCRKAGKHDAEAVFVIWNDSYFSILGGKKTSGPLTKCKNRGELSNILFDMVKKYISDDKILLELKTDNIRYKNGDFTGYGQINATLSW